MNVSPESATFLIPWQAAADNVCWATAQEIVATAADPWPAAGYYVGMVAQSGEEFEFMSARIVRWIDHFMAVRRPPLGDIAKAASV